MRRLLAWLLVCVVGLGMFAQTARAQTSSNIPRSVTKQLRWCTWTPLGPVTTADTTFLAGTYGTDTTESVHTADWSWTGAGSAAIGAANMAVGRVWAEVSSAGWIDSNVDTVCVFVEQSMDNINWSSGGAVLSLATWHTQTALVNEYVGTGNNAPMVCMAAPLLVTQSAGAAINSAGTWSGAPFLRFRVRNSVGANDKVSGLKFFVTYFQR